MHNHAPWDGSSVPLLPLLLPPQRLLLLGPALLLLALLQLLPCTASWCWPLLVCGSLLHATTTRQQDRV